MSAVLARFSSARATETRLWSNAARHYSTRLNLTRQSSRREPRPSLNATGVLRVGSGSAVLISGSYARNYWWSSKKAPVESPTSVEPTTPAPVSSALPPNQGVPPTASTEPITAPTEPITAVPDLPTPVEVSVSPDASSAAIDSLSNLASNIPIQPLQFGDLNALGLISWTPAGLVRESFEIVNVVSGLPWFYTIIVGTLLWRLVVTPFSISSIRNSARLLPKQAEFLALRQEMNAARASSDKMALQRVMLKQQKAYKDAGVSIGAMAMSPFIQLPITLGVFFGVKRMCELPVMQLTQSGFAALPDLTVSDPYMVLPIALAAIVNLQITAGAKEMNMAERPEMGHLMNGLRILSVLGIWVMSNFPSGLMISLLVTSGSTALQSFLLRIPSVRTRLGIPIVPRHQQGRIPTFKESGQWIRSYYTNKMEEAKRQALIDRKRKEAGRRR